MSFRAIPRRLLIHTVNHIQTEEEGSWGGSGDEETTKIERVRFEPSSQVRKSLTNEEVQVRGVLFIDRKHSKPFVIPEVDSVIEFKGQKLTVLSSEPIFAKTDDPHHVEVYLT